MTTYRMKLTDFQMRALIGVLVWYRNILIADGGDTDEVDELLLMVMDVYDTKKS